MIRLTPKTLCGAKKHARSVFLLIVTGIIVGFTACEDADMNVDVRSMDADAGQQIQFKTTASNSLTNNQLFEVGDSIGIYSVIWQNNNQTPGELLSSGNYDDNKLYYLLDENDNWGSLDPIYYPIDGSKIDLYAYYPYLETPMDSGAVLSVHVHADQSTLDSYQKSDFKAATARGLNYESGPFHFDFYHRLSQVRFEIVAGTGVRPEQLLGAEIKLTNVITDGAYAYPGVIQDYIIAGSERSDITPCGLFELEKGKVTGKAAIIVPQTLGSGSRIEVIFANRTISADFAEQVAFNMGESRLITITLTANGIDFTTEIKPWDEQPPVEEKDLIGYFDINCESGNYIEFRLRNTKDITINWGDGHTETIVAQQVVTKHTYTTSDRRIFNVKIYGEKDALEIFSIYIQSTKAIVQGNVFFDSNTLREFDCDPRSPLVRITDLDLSNCPQLEALIYAGDKDNKYPLKVHLPQNSSVLYNLEISYTDSLEITPCFTGYPNLRNLELIDVELKTIDVANMPKIGILRLSSNKDLTEVALCPNIRSLELNECINLKEIDIRNCADLVYFHMQESGIENIISNNNNSKIDALFASKSKISELDLSFWSKLSRIELDGTLISELDFSNNPRMVNIQCQKTPLNDNEDALLRMAYSLPELSPRGGNLYVNQNAVSVIDSICTKKNWTVRGVR